MLIFKSALDFIHNFYERKEFFLDLFYTSMAGGIMTIGTLDAGVVNADHKAVIDGAMLFGGFILFLFMAFYRIITMHNKALIARGNIKKQALELKDKEAKMEDEDRMRELQIEEKRYKINQDKEEHDNRMSLYYKSIAELAAKANSIEELSTMLVEDANNMDIKKSKGV